MTSSTASGPLVRRDHVTFRFHDPRRRVADVTLYQEITRPRLGPAFARRPDRDVWELRWPRPDVGRMEYRLQVTDGGGRVEVVCDPSNPVRAPGPSGDRSVLVFPGYVPPTWLGDADVERGRVIKTSILTRSLRAGVPTMVWSPPGARSGQTLPLLIVHDGPDYARYSGLLLMLDRLFAERRLPPMRAALLALTDRDEHYSASALYARALGHEILPALAQLAPSPPGRNMRIGMGASLGALAMLHAHRALPASFGALFLQSGSYFRPRYDEQEAHFVRFRRISRFVGTIHSATQWAHPIPITMTCGTVEENLANNRCTRDALAGVGYEVRFVENRDAHNWIAWRDTFDPFLVDLINDAWA